MATNVLIIENDERRVKEAIEAFQHYSQVTIVASFEEAVEAIKEGNFQFMVDGIGFHPFMKLLKLCFENGIHPLWVCPKG